MALQGMCLSIAPPLNSSAPIVAVCNLTHSDAPFEASCSPQHDAACSYPADMGAADPRLADLCALICSGCSSL